MAPFRMPFSNRKGPIAQGQEPSDENARPGLISRGSGSLGLKTSGEEPSEYKLSSVNDSGIYLPPSPTEKKSFWHRSPTSTTSSNHRSMLSENEPFSISRESFESYRRSFDISGRSPVLQGDSFPSRTSLDSRALRLPRSAVKENTFDRPSRAPRAEKTVDEDIFEDVGLHDEPKPKKKSFLSRFGESAAADSSAPGAGGADAGPGAGAGTGTGKSHFGLHLPGRKRGQSGQGAELGTIERPASSKGKAEVAAVR